jgi:hypothetical protein
MLKYFTKLHSKDRMHTISATSISAEHLWTKKPGKLGNLYMQRQSDILGEM